MKRFMLVGVMALAFGLVGTLPAFGQASREVEYYYFPYDDVSVNYCTNEPVHYQGFYEVRTQRITSPVGGQTYMVWYHQRLEGVGLETGTTYALESHYQNAARAMVEGGGVEVITFPASYIEVSRGPAGNYRATGILHLTVNASGELVSEVVIERAGCVGG
jgi:hypothetical protein